MVIFLEQGAFFYMAQLMPLPLTVSCFSKIQIGFTFLVPAHLGSPGQRAVKRVCVVLAHLVSPGQRAVKRVCVCVSKVSFCLASLLLGLQSTVITSVTVTNVSTREFGSGERKDKAKPLVGVNGLCFLQCFGWLGRTSSP